MGKVQAATTAQELPIPALLVLMLLLVPPPPMLSGGSTSCGRVTHLIACCVKKLFRLFILALLHHNFRSEAENSCSLLAFSDLPMTSCTWIISPVSKLLPPKVRTRRLCLPKNLLCSCPCLFQRYLFGMV